MSARAESLHRAEFTLTPREAKRVKRWATQCRDAGRVRWTEEEDGFLFDAIVAFLNESPREYRDRESTP